ncbi:hypothetical protein K443DRAFT_65734, partial [Laccaria amethystina LaAM-08-1]
PAITGRDRFILTGPVFCGLGPVWLRSFSGHETGLPNTSCVRRCVASWLGVMVL